MDEATRQKLQGKTYNFYGRVSDPNQKKGRGLQRQDDARNWMEHDLGMVPGRTYLDPGRSGWTGAHRKRGEWKQVLKDVDNKVIKRGEALGVEEFDRMSREEVFDIALPQFIKIIKAGIILCTYLDREIYDEEILRTDKGIFMLQQSIMRMAMAHEFSEARSERRKNTNELIRKTGKIVGHFKWLKRKKPGETPQQPWEDWGHPEFFVHGERARVVELIFHMYLDQAMGFDAIRHELNNRGIPTFSTGWNRNFSKSHGKWTRTVVRLIVQNPAYMGTYAPKKWIPGGYVDGEKQPPKQVSAQEPQEDRLPIIIPKTRWYAAQLKCEQRRESGGNRGSIFSNLFCNGLARCGHCGSTIYLAGTRKKQSETILKCGQYHAFAREGRNDHGCSHPIVYPYWVLEEQAKAVVQFMLERQDPNAEAMEAIENGDDPELLDLLKRLIEMQDYLKELQDYQPGKKSVPKRAISELEAQIRKQEKFINERQMTTNRLQAILDLWKQSREPTNDPERKAMRTKLHEELTDVLDIKLYGAARADRKWISREAKIYWKPPRGGMQLMFQWHLRHMNSVEAARFDGLFVVQPETGEIIEQLTEGPDLDMSILNNVTRSFNGHDTRFMRRESRRGEWQAFVRLPERLHSTHGQWWSWNTGVPDNGTAENEARALELAKPHIEEWRQKIREAEIELDLLDEKGGLAYTPRHRKPK